MKHYIHLDCALHGSFVLLKSGFLDSAHRSCSSAESGISCYRILIIKDSAAVAFPCITLKIIVQIFLMGTLLNTLLFQSGIIQTPANIIMAAQIIQEYIILR